MIIKKQSWIIIWLVLGMTVQAGEYFYGYRNLKNSSMRQKTWLKNSFTTSYHFSQPTGKSGDLHQNGNQFDLGYKFRFYRSLTYYLNFSLAGYDAFRDLQAYGDFIDMEGITDISVRKINLYTGLKVYFPIYHRFSISVLGTVGLTHMQVHPTVTPGLVVTESSFRQELKNNLLKPYDYRSLGWAPGTQIGIGLEYLFKFRVGLEGSAILQNEFSSSGIASSTQIGLMINYYFKSLGFPDDLFRFYR
ncbi:MAG: hypothetical protein KBA26_11685 [Candidatus Delongbacteria bacterium]|nr:hypothetical protein [Candidatus Delongbacteria bacterium]